jgi:hypothetical protein
VTDGANLCNQGLYNDVPESSAQCDGAPCPPVPPVSLEQLLSTHNELIQKLVENDDGRALRQQDHQLPHDSSYSDFLATHPLVFAKVIDPLEADNSFLNTKSKFVLLRCNEYQKTIYTVQQLHGFVRVPSGRTTPPHFRTTIRCREPSSVIPSVAITFQRVS